MSEQQQFKTFIPDSNGKYQYVTYDPRSIIAGDTDSTYVDLSPVFNQEDSEAEVISFADQLGITVNDSFPEFLKAVFNCSQAQAEVIETEREVVSDKSCFMGKKNYVMHVVNQDGVPKDKYKVVGLATRRSDTPKVIQDFLTEMLERVMDLESYEEIQAFIQQFKDQYSTLPLQKVGRPMTIKVLRKYEELFLAQNSMKGFSYHVRASLFYNSLCGPSDIQIRSGDKISIVYLNHPETNYIAVPVDAPHLPAAIDGLQIDWERQWETVQKKINLYLKPGGLDRESRQQKKVESLMSF